MSISSESHNTWCVRMTAYLLTAAQVSNLHTWDPKQHSMLDSIIGHTVEKPVVCNGFRQDEPDGPKMYQGNCRLTFQGESFLHHLSNALNGNSAVSVFRQLLSQGARRTKVGGREAIVPGLLASKQLP